jgi:cell division protein FtsW
MVTITLLMFIGVVAVYSALSGMEGPQEGTPWYKLTSFRSMMFAPLAFAAMLLMSRFPYRSLDGRLIWVLLAFTVVLLLLVYVPGIGVEKNFRRRWVKVPGAPESFSLGFQPSEVAKFTLVVFLAWWLGRKGADPRSFLRGFLPAAGVLTVVAGLVAKEDMGTGVIISAVGLAMLMIGGCRWWHPTIFAVPAVAGLLFVFLDTTRMNRLLRQFTENRELDVLGKDYQIVQSLRAIANGGLFGQGLGEGWQKLGFLPLRASDFVLASISEEVGLVGVAAVLAVYAVLLYQGGRIMTNARERFGQLIAFGITFIFGMQAFIHAGVVTKLLPNKGINLPFVSAGGTGLIIMGFAGGLLAAVARGTSGAKREERRAKSEEQSAKREEPGAEGEEPLAERGTPGGRSALQADMQSPEVASGKNVRLKGGHATRSGDGDQSAGLGLIPAAVAVPAVGIDESDDDIPVAEPVAERLAADGRFASGASRFALCATPSSGAKR